MKIKELRLLNIKIIKEGNTIYEGFTEEIPNDLKEIENKNTYFEGVNLVVEI